MSFDKFNFKHKIKEPLALTRFADALQIERGRKRRKQWMRQEDLKNYSFETRQEKKKELEFHQGNIIRGFSM